jgi:hypothetical protein
VRHLLGTKVSRRLDKLAQNLVDHIDQLVKECLDVRQRQDALASHFLNRPRHDARSVAIT